MTTCADMIQETRRILYSGHRDPMNSLAGAHDASTTTFTFTYALGAITGGAYLSVDLEILYVWAVTNAGTKTVTVQRGALGSTAASHADTSVVTINPKFPDFSIFQAINNDLDDLSGPLYSPKTITLTYNAAVGGYDMTGVTSMLGKPLRVKFETPGPVKDWPEARAWEYRRDAKISDFPSGFSLVVYGGGYAGRDVRVTYPAPFDHFTASTDNATVTGLAASMYDLPSLGAAIRLQSVREGQRNFNEAQVDSRRSDEVPVGAQLAGVRGLMQVRNDRIKSEAGNQRQAYPPRRVLPV